MSQQQPVSQTMVHKIAKKAAREARAKTRAAARADGGDDDDDDDGGGTRLQLSFIPDSGTVRAAAAAAAAALAAAALAAADRADCAVRALSESVEAFFESAYKCQEVMSALRATEDAEACDALFGDMEKTLKSLKMARASIDRAAAAAAAAAAVDRANGSR